MMFLLARIFGHKIFGVDLSHEDEYCIVTMYKWRGKTYLTRVKTSELK